VPTDDVQWDPPAAGMWFLTTEHFPRPVSRLFSTLFPSTTLGWDGAARRYGLPAHQGRWAAVNSWLYYAPQAGDWFDGNEAVAAETLRTQSWRSDIDRWFESDRRRVIGLNRVLQAEDPTALDDVLLADHLRRAIDHYLSVGRLHFELHTAFSIGGGLAAAELAAWGIGHDGWLPLMRGASPASSAARAHIDQIVGALDQAEPRSVDDIRAAGPAAVAALDAYLDDYGWRCLDQHELRGNTLIERPDILLTSVRARMTHPDSSTSAVETASTRADVPDGDHPRFDEVISGLRRAYGCNDDNVGITWSWPLGLIRRSVLELGRRLVERGAIDDADVLFEADRNELTALLDGTARPDLGSELATRNAAYLDAPQLNPPTVLDQPVDTPERPEPSASVARLVSAQQALWALATPSTEPLTGIGIGDVAYRGRACVIDGDGYLDLEPGDVIVATVTHAGHNTVFPIAGAVTTACGNLLSHPAVLARELGLSAVLSVNGLLERVHTGDLIEVDPVAGVVRVLID